MESGPESFIHKMTSLLNLKDIAAALRAFDPQVWASDFHAASWLTRVQVLSHFLLAAVFAVMMGAMFFAFSRKSRLKPKWFFVISFFFFGGLSFHQMLCLLVFKQDLSVFYLAATAVTAAYLFLTLLFFGRKAGGVVSYDPGALERLQAQLTEEKDSHDKTRLKLTAARKKMEEEKTTAAESLEVTKRELREVESRIGAYVEERQRITAANEKLKEDAEALSRKIFKESASSNELKQNFEALKSEFAKHKNAFANLSEHASQLQKEMAELKGREESLLKEKDGLSGELERSRESASALERALEESRQSGGQLASEKESLHAEIAQLRAEKEEAIAGLQRELEESRQAVNAIAAEKDALNAAVSQLQTEKEEIAARLDAVAREQDSWRQSGENTNRELEDLRNMKSVLEGQLAEAEQKLQQSEERLRSKMQDAISAKDILRREMQAWQEKEKDLSGQISREIAAREGAEAALQKLSEDMVQLESELNAKREALESASSSQVQENAPQPVKSVPQDFALGDALNAILWEYDLGEGRYVYVSSRAEELLGYPQTSWTQDPAFWESHVHGVDRARVTAFRRKVAEEKKTAVCEYRMISAEGKTIWFQETVTVIWEKDRPSRLRGSMSDMTATVRMREDISRQKNFIEAVLETPRLLIVRLDMQGKVTEFNRVGQQLTGMRLADIAGRSFWDVFSEDAEKGSLQSVLARMMAGQFPLSFESTLSMPDGTRRKVAWHGTAILGRDELIDQLVATGSLKEVVADAGTDTPQEEPRHDHSDQQPGV